MASRRSRLLTALLIVGAIAAALLTRVSDERDASAFDFIFVDIPGGAYYESAVYWMVQEVITTGTSPTTYSPEDPVTRAQMALFLYRFAAIPGDYPDHPFDDVLSTDRFNEAVDWLLFFDITTGTSPTTYSPDDSVTRAQMAAFLYRLALEPVTEAANPFGDVPVGSYYYDAVRWMYSEGITNGTNSTTYSPHDPVTRGQFAALLWRFAGEPAPDGLPTTTTTPGATTSTTTTVFAPDPADMPGPPPTTLPLDGDGNYLRIVSIPDFFNVDVGTIASVFDPAVGICGEVPCGDSRSYELDRSIWYILESIKADNPDFVMVAGDLVNGHWYADQFDRGVFGPTETVDEKAAAIDLAGDVYYSQWLDRFDQRDLDVYPAVGDHELGDNDWAPRQARSQLVDDFRAEFAQHFTQNPDGSSKYDGTVTSRNVPARPPTSQWSDTAYAFQEANLLVITLDVWYQQDPNLILGDNGSVLPTVQDTQLIWLDDLLTGADNDESIDHVIVQGHTPTLAPVRARATSEIYLRDLNTNTGADTEFWQTLAAHDVPLYLAGEVHDVTHSRSDGVHQVVHGGTIGFLSPVNYLVIDVYADRINMHIKQLDVQNTSTELWQARALMRREITIFDFDWQLGFRPTGWLELTKAGNGGYVDTTPAIPGPGILACFSICRN